MNTLPGYQITEKIQESFQKIIYRGVRESERTPVIIKTLKAEYPTIQEITRLRNEYKISETLQLEGVVRTYSLEKYKNSFALILEDMGGQSLKQFLNARSIPVIKFLKIAIQLAQFLGELHQKQIIHKDIKPSNIIINPSTEQVKITDFSISTRLTRETHQASNTSLLEGTIAYMSPEQTGRMNRSIDYRTDFYSLGATFYEMLTGQLPFNAIDPLELIHCHIALTPVPPHQLNPEIPETVSSIVIKLLAKNAEDRYQSAFGLKADLETCLIQLLDTGKIEHFIPGKLDQSSQFLIPQKLYGRSSEVATLMSSFERVSSGVAEMMLVSGYSGIGKTSVINEVHKPIVRQRGYFIAGKFDQFKRNIPYAALIQSFQSLLQQLLTETSDKIALWQEKLLSRLGKNGQVIVDVIPEVELIIGPQPALPQLGPTESQNRFNRVFKEFIHVFTQPEHPLVLFLDDLQWADPASLKLIHLLLSDPNSQYLLLIGAYRDNEVSPTHPLIQTIEKIQQSGARVNNIILQPLEIDHVSQLVADTLHCELERSRSLAELVFNKTGGNPFFLTQLLQILHSEKLLTFNFTPPISPYQGGAIGGWQWNIKQIHAIGITDYNVVELVARNLQKLPQTTQQVLKLAACIGNQFNLDVLAIVNEKSQSDTAADLWEALQAGLILPSSDAYKIPLVFEEASVATINRQRTTDKGQLTISYKFLHDRVQQAAYSLIPDSQKKQTHLQIGQLLLKNTPAEEIEENIFDIVNQLNIGRKLILNHSERDRLAELNLIAGKKAKLSTAYEAARRYLNIGLELLPGDSWQNYYELTLTLYVEAVEAEYLNANFEQAEKLADVVLQQAKTLLEKVKIYETKIQYYGAQSQMKLAIDTALSILKKLGVHLPKQPNQLRILMGLLRTKLALGSNSIEALASLPEMTDPYKLAAMGMLDAALPATFVGMPQLFPLIVFKMIDLSLKYGNMPLSIGAYSSYGLIHCAILGDINSGYRYGQLGLTLLQQLNATERKAQTQLIFNTFTRHWKEHLKETIEPLLEGIQSGLETGKIEDACYCATQYCGYLFMSGEPLLPVNRKQVQYIEMMIKYKQEVQINHAKLWGQLVLNLLVYSETPYQLTGELFNEETLLPSLIEAKNKLAVFAAYVAKSFLCYWFKDYTNCAKNAYEAEKYAEGSLGTAYIPLHKFYSSLGLLALYPTASKSEQKKYLSKVASYQKKMKHWAKHAPENYLHKYQLVEAEKARVLGKNEKAAQYYNRAIEAAKNAKYIQEEALANELAAEFYFSQSKENKASKHLIDAYYGYIHWGAVAKVRDLESRYAQFFDRIISKETTAIGEQHSTRATIMSTSSMNLDLSTVLKASQAISSEIVLDKLLSKLMQVIMENAGAQKGLLFLQQEDSLVLVAKATFEEKQEIVLPYATVSDGLDLPISVINYIQRTRETLVLNEINTEKLFSQDPYIVARQPKSVLVFPLISQGKLRGILYLENRLTQGAFTQERLELLKVLTSQVSISIENARLYSNLERQALHDALTDLPNRRLFNRRLDQALSNARKNQNLVAVMFMDLDRFKKINDSLGHGIGDRLLQSFAQRLRSCLRESDTVARWGGDEFTVLLPQISSAEEATQIGKRILDALKQPFKLENQELYIKNSIGIAIYPTDGEDASTLLKNADAALQVAKEGGKNKYEFYSPKINSQADLLLRLENLLHQALEREEFLLYYQPQVNVNTGEIGGMEALLRWQHPELGLVSPGQFIPVAEESGLIVPIGEWVLRTACAQNKAWQEAGLPPLKVAVNLSCQQFQQQDLVPMVAQILKETGLKPGFLELEITETTIMENIDLARKTIKDLQGMGVYLSMDDFGTGYSSLGYLKNFPFDSLKIDQSFVRGLRNDPREIAILSSIISLGHGLGLRVVAEGVETQQQLELLRSLKCEEMQGYLFSRPLKVEDATCWLSVPQSGTHLY